MGVLRRPVFWTFLLLQVALKHSYLFPGGLFEYLNSLNEVNWHGLGVISGITTFFEVFYTNNCYFRYHILYEEMRGMFGLLAEVSMHLHVHVSPSSHEHARLCSRYL